MKDVLIMCAEKGYSTGITQKSIRFFSSVPSMINYFETAAREECIGLQEEIEKAQLKLDGSKDDEYGDRYLRGLIERNRTQIDRIVDRNIEDYLKGHRHRFFLAEPDSGQKPKKTTFEKLQKLASQGF